MNEILTIALNTQKEAIRNKVFYIILLFVLLLLASSILLATLALGEEDRIVKHLGLSAINVFGLLLAAFVGVNLVHEELEKRTIYTIIATGVSRTQFILGKFLGLLLTVMTNVVVMGIILCILLVIMPNCRPTPSVIYAIFLFLFEMMVITAIAVLFSSFSTPVLSAALTLICYVIGHLSEDLLEFAKRLTEQGSVIMAKVLTAVYYILPNLEIYNIKNQVVYQENISAFLTWKYPALAILYSGILLLITAFSFSRRDFK
ncbi:MAG TPA: ABC transporter permease subunit [bacterium]|nr:ABC transporter permease subunit [bacterium]HQO36757.1 ABC transporter permease subunit [bacterium]HQP97539.1 ABC transporter permease subunit [bacterium]